MGASAKEWYAVRCVIQTDPNSPRGSADLEAGELEYEERICVWKASTVEEAFEYAERDAVEYTKGLELKYTGFAQSFHLFGTPRHGAEVFSLIRKSCLSTEDYLSTFFDTGREIQADFRQQ